MRRMLGRLVMVIRVGVVPGQACDYRRSMGGPFRVVGPPILRRTLGTPMPYLDIPPDWRMFCRVDDFTDPWTKPETVLLLHGNAESGIAWNGWMSHLSRRYRVVRPDRRGFGQSTPMPKDYAWSFDVLIDDHLRLMDALGIE